MNTSKPQRALNLSESTYQERLVISSVVQKVTEKKWVILRKACFFFLGLGFYLVFSAL